MEHMPQNARESGVSRIVGVEKATEESLLHYFKEKFESEQKNNFEKKHSKELDKIINVINEYLQDFLKEYGINSIPIPTKNIHVIDQERLTPQQIESLKQQYEEINGFYISSKQQIGMLVEYKDDKKLSFLQTLIHEMLHVNSFLSFQKLSEDKKDQGQRLTRESEDDKEEKISLGVRRMGFRIQSLDGETHFDHVDEAIITELTMRFDWRYFSQFPELGKELQRRQEIIDAQSRRSGESTNESRRRFADIEEAQNQDGSWTTTLKGYSYDQERDALNKLVNDLFERNQSEFSSSEEVFSIFARASMTGRLLPVARLIEKTYGRGSFREIGEKSGRKD